MHEPVQSVAQHTLSTQRVDAHSRASAQESPSVFFVRQIPDAQKFCAGHSVSVAQGLAQLSVVQG